MGKAFETIACQATAPGVAALVPFAAVAGNSLRVRDADSAVLLDLWSVRQGGTGGAFRLTSPLLHDAQVGITQVIANGVLTDLGPVQFGMPVPNPLTPQDNLVASGSGSAVAGQIESSFFQIMYDNLPGVDANLITSADLYSRGVEIYSPRVTVTPTAAGGYTGQIAINSLEDQLKANHEYAILGITVDGGNTGIAGIRFVSPDFGNLGIVSPYVPGYSSRSSEYFNMLAQRTGLPTIPVINSSQKDSIFISALGNQAAAVANTFAINMVRLSERKSKRR